MTDKTFAQIYKWEAEKGLSDKKNDKGGVTNDGITWVRFQQICKIVLKEEPTRERFEALTRDDIVKFYTFSFENIGCDKIENPLLAGVCFDFALNSSKGKREIQKVLYELGYRLKIDNIFGPITLRCLNKACKAFGALKVCNLILAQRQKYVEMLVERDETQKVFFAGWINRIEDWKKFVKEYA